MKVFRTIPERFLKAVERNDLVAVEKIRPLMCRFLQRSDANAEARAAYHSALKRSTEAGHRDMALHLINRDYFFTYETRCSALLYAVADRGLLREMGFYAANMRSDVVEAYMRYNLATIPDIWIPQEMMNALKPSGILKNGALADVAIRLGRNDVLMYLLEKCDLDPRVVLDSNGTSLYDVAARKDNKEAATILARHFMAEAAPAPAPVSAPAQSVWKKCSGDNGSIARVVEEKTLGYRITEIFNFIRREKIGIVENLDNGHQSHETRYFDEAHDADILQTALEQLKAQGGVVPEMARLKNRRAVLKNPDHN